MRFAMLREGHRDQVAMMQKNTLVRVFIPMDSETAFTLVTRGLDSRVGKKKEVSGIGDVRAIEVEYYLEDAIQEGTVVAQIFIKGKYLYPASITSGFEQAAQQQYPESYYPTVSMALLDHSKETEVFINGQVGAEDVVKIYLVGWHPEGYRLTGEHSIQAEYDVEEFLNWHQGFLSRQAQIRSGTEPGSSRDPKRVMSRLKKEKGWGNPDPRV